MPSSKKPPQGKDQEISNLQELLDRIDQEATGKGEITLGSIVEAVGRRSFGPLLLLAGVIIASPISGIPGVPTTMGIVVLLIAGQLLFRRQQFWLPRFILNRSASAGRIYRTLRTVRPAARVVDRIIKPRLPVFTEGPAIYVVAVACAAIALFLPMMEVVPFSAHGAGLALTAFGLSLISRDGLLSLVAFIITASIFGLVGYNMIVD